MTRIRGDDAPPGFCLSSVRRRSFKGGKSWLGEQFSSATTAARKSARTKARHCASRLPTHVAARRSRTCATHVRGRCPAGLLRGAGGGRRPQPPEVVPSAALNERRRR